MKTETAANSTNSFSFASTSKDEKYNGILEKSKAKMFRKQISELISYVYSVSPSFTMVHYVIMFIRILQLVGPSLFPGYLEFWETDPTASKTIFVFTMFFYIIPPSVHDIASFPAMIVYLIFTAFSIVFILI